MISTKIAARENGNVFLPSPKIKKILHDLCCRLPAYEPEELLENAAEAEDHDEAVEAVLKVAAAFPRFDSGALRVFITYLKSPYPTIRKATLQAIAYRLWPETSPLLETVVQEDPDEDVRDFARTILAYST